MLFCWLRTAVTHHHVQCAPLASYVIDHVPYPRMQTKTVENLRQTLKTAVLEETKKRELTNVIQAHFKEWLISKFELIFFRGALMVRRETKLYCTTTSNSLS